MNKRDAGKDPAGHDRFKNHDSDKSETFKQPQAAQPAEKQVIKGMYNWLGKQVHARYGTYVFSLLVFIEGFFIVPVSTMLAFYCLENRKRALFYAFIATLFSLFAALAGYYLGLLLWNTGGQKLIYWLIAPEKFNYIVQKYKEYQAWTIFIVALTPMPFKALTLTAGFCKLPLTAFLIFTLIARGIRFYAIAISIYCWGDKVNYYLNKYFYYVLVLGIAFIILLIWLIH